MGTTRFELLSAGVIASLAALAMGAEPGQGGLGETPTSLAASDLHFDLALGASDGMAPASGSADAAPPITVASNLSFDRQPDAQTPTASEPIKAAPATDHHDAAVKLQNPVADLISVPIQFNWDTGIGPDDDKDQIKINVEPVIPIKLNKDWNLISRTIVPVMYAEGPTTGIDDQFGIGDTLQSLFFSPAKPIDGWILGAGPALLIPTGTDDLFRTKQFGMGPTGVALRQDKIGDATLTYGMLVNHLWRVAGSDRKPDVNATFMQPFISYTLKGGTTFSLNTETGYDWTSEEWSVPLNASMSQLMKFGDQMVQLQFGGRYYVDTAPNGPEWGVRFTITFLFPQ